MNEKIEETLDSGNGNAFIYPWDLLPEEGVEPATDETEKEAYEDEMTESVEQALSEEVKSEPEDNHELSNAELALQNARRRRRHRSMSVLEQATRQQATDANAATRSASIEYKGSIIGSTTTIAQRRAENAENIATTNQRMNDDASLRTAIQRQHPFTNTIRGVEVLGKGTAEETIAAAILLDDQTKVLIPFGNMFAANAPLDESVIDTSTNAGRNELITRQRQILEKMVGAEISFCLTWLDSQSEVRMLLGSRALAQRHAMTRAFGGRNPRFKVGDVAEGIITGVSVHSITICLEGVDCTVQQYRLTYRWVLDCHEVYSIGDHMRVLIKEIKPAEDGTVSLTIDPLRVELAEAKIRASVCADGTNTTGIITNITRTKNGRMVIYAHIDKYDLPAVIYNVSPNDFGRVLRAGTLLSLTVREHLDTGHLLCFARSEHGNSNMFRPVKTWN